MNVHRVCLRSRIKAIKDYCDKKGDSHKKLLGYHQPYCSLIPTEPRYDRYESVTLYWYEEDLEFEWEKSHERAVREQTSFNTDVSAADALLDAREPIAVDMKRLTAGGLFVSTLERILCLLFRGAPRINFGDPATTQERRSPQPPDRAEAPKAFGACPEIHAGHRTTAISGSGGA